MEKTRITKLAAIIVAFVLLLGTTIGTGVSAVVSDDIAETASIESINIEHRDFLHLAFEVVTVSVTEGAEIGIMIWDAGVTDYTVSNRIWVSYELKNDGAGTDYYSSMPIAAKNIATKYQVAVVEKTADGVTLVSKPALYSVAGWAQIKLDAPETTDPAEINLYNKVKAYGAAAAALFND